MAMLMTMIHADKYQRISTTKKVRVGRRRLKLLRIKLKKLCVIRRLLRSWRSLTKALRSLFVSNASCDSDNWPSKDHHHHRRRHCSYGRSNSFYAEAIAECLEFIKRSSNGSADSHNPHDRLL